MSKLKDNVLNRDCLCENMALATAEAYRVLRTNLTMSASGNGHCKLIGITCPTSFDEKSAVAINLAYSLAQTDAKVLLIDGNLRSPRVSEALEIVSSFHYGISDLVMGKCTKQISVISGSISKNLDILPAGTVPPNPSELLSSNQMKALLTSLSLYYDYIIIDLPAVNEYADPLVLANSLDGYVLAVKEDFTSKTDINQCLSQIRLINAKMFGFVLTGAKEAIK